MGNALVLVWRESLEAVLVIGILYASLKRTADGSNALRYLWGGTVAGIGLSLLLAFVSFQIQTQLQGDALANFQTGVLFVAAALITQMVLWMSKHGRHMKRNLEANLDRAMTTSGLMGIALVAALAVGREGAETVVFLYSMSVESSNGSFASVLTGALLGFLLALLTSWAVSRGVRGLNYRVFFKVTGIVLLFLASGLLVSGTSQLLDSGALPSLVDSLWDTTFILDDRSMLGSIIAAFTGYRAQPSLMLVLVYAIYWIAVLSWTKWRDRVTARMAPGMHNTTAKP